MGTIHNEILIQAPVEKIWGVLASPELLDKYDPTVRKSSLISNERTSLGAKRRVEMLDGKNWFEEKITECKPNEALTYELTACSFPVHKLKHSYTFQKLGGQTKVSQIMEYTVKFGLIGRLLDVLMIRKQSDAGIKKFFGGLKSYIETR
ncbi:MAG: SRPBCC family protein [Bacteroidetes bacterium]|nr:SRPBCC family protein [Bacteroidota bacterium]